MKSLNVTLAFIALVLASLALFVGNPKERSHTLVDIKELAKAIEREEDHITADELANELMHPSTRWQIIDLRDSASFAEYHIPNAERKEISQLVEEPLSKKDTILLYSDGGLHAVQAWMLLTAKGYRNIFTLRGGIYEWNTTIRFPVSSQTLSTEEREKLATRAKFFGGELKVNQQTDTLLKPPPKKKPQKPPERKIEREKEKLRNEC